MMALSGVRNSWLILARNADFVREAASASARALLGLVPRGADVAGIVAEHRQRPAHVAELVAAGGGIGAASSPRAIASMLVASSVSRRTT